MVEFLHDSKQCSLLRHNFFVLCSGSIHVPSPQVRPDQVVVTDWDFRACKNTSESIAIMVISTNKENGHRAYGEYRKPAREHKSKCAKGEGRTTKQPDKTLARQAPCRQAEKHAVKTHSLSLSLSLYLSLLLRHMPQEEKQHQSCARAGSRIPQHPLGRLSLTLPHRGRSHTCRLEATIVASFHRGSISRLTPASFTPSPIPLLGANSTTCSHLRPPHCDWHTMKTAHHDITCHVTLGGIQLVATNCPKHTVTTIVQTAQRVSHVWAGEFASHPLHSRQASRKVISCTAVLRWYRQPSVFFVFRRKPPCCILPHFCPPTFSSV